MNNKRICVYACISIQNLTKTNTRYVEQSIIYTLLVGTIWAEHRALLYYTRKHVPSISIKHTHMYAYAYMHQMDEP